MTLQEKRQDGLETVYFKESVRMSTYLVAFVVCDYSSLTAETKGGVTVGTFPMLIWPKVSPF